MAKKSSPPNKTHHCCVCSKDVPEAELSEAERDLAGREQAVDLVRPMLRAYRADL